MDISPTDGKFTDALQHPLKYAALPSRTAPEYLRTASIGHTRRYRTNADALSMRLMDEQQSTPASGGEATADDDADRLAEALRDELDKALERDPARFPESYKVALPRQIPKLLHNIDEETKQLLNGLDIAADDN